MSGWPFGRGWFAVSIEMCLLIRRLTILFGVLRGSRQILIAQMRTAPGMNARTWVVVLNWNGRAFLGACLQSLLQQTYPDYRVMLVDNGSTDGSRDLIRDEFPEIRLVPLPENRHFAKGSNAGLREALRDPECAYVATLNNDTRVDPEWLAQLVRHATPDVGMVATKLLFMDRPHVINSTGLAIAPDGSGMDRGWNQRDEGQYEESYDVFGASAGAALYRREALDSVGIFDEDFLAYYEDLDLAWRIRLRGWQARFAPRSIVYHKFAASFGRGSFLKTYLCERNRIWNLLQNYPWRYVAVGLPWNSARLLAGPLPWHHTRESENEGEARVSDTAKAIAQGRLDAYAGVRRALAKRRRRGAAQVDAGTVGRWLRRYGVSFRETVRA